MSIAYELWKNNGAKTLTDSMELLEQREYTKKVYDSYGATFMEFEDGSCLIFDNGNVGISEQGMDEEEVKELEAKYND